MVEWVVGSLKDECSGGGGQRRQSGHGAGWLTVSRAKAVPTLTETLAQCCNITNTPKDKLFFFLTSSGLLFSFHLCISHRSDQPKSDALSLSTWCKVVGGFLPLLQICTSVDNNSSPKARPIF